MRLVVIESPFAGEIEANIAYARRCVKDCLARKESPYASHLFFTQPGVLDDTNPEERALGIAAGLAWASKAEASVVYIDRGISSGMKEGVLAATNVQRDLEFRAFDQNSFKDFDVAAFIRAVVLAARFRNGKVIINLEDDVRSHVGFR